MQFIILLSCLLFSSTLFSLIDGNLPFFLFFKEQQDYCFPEENNNFLSVNFLVRTAFGGFDSDYRHTHLGNTFFGTEFILEDIFLNSRLSADGKIRIPPPGFGSNPTQQYTTCLAPTELIFSPCFTQYRIDFFYNRFFCFSRCPSIRAMAGINLPVVFQQRDLNFRARDGSLLCTTPTLGESNLTQFFTDFKIDFTDFFERGILDPKGIEYRSSHKKAGLGDIKVFSVCDISDYVFSALATKHQMDLLCGAKLIFPTGHRADEDFLFDISFDGLHKTAFSFFLFYQLAHERLFFTPFVYGEVCFPFSYTSKKRIPQIKTEQSSNLILLERFSGYMLLPFQEIDSKVAAFADESIRASIHPGPEMVWYIGNTFNNLCDHGFLISVWYALSYAGKDSIKISEGSFKPELAERLTERVRQSVAWSLSFKPRDTIYFQVGTHHVFSGKNIFQEHAFFMNFMVSF